MRTLVVMWIAAIGCGPGPRAGDDTGGGDAAPAVDAPIVDPCDPAVLGTSYIGCDYYPTILGSNVGTMFDYAIAIANAGDRAGTVHIDGGALAAPIDVAIAPDAVVVQTLPWVAALKLCESTMTDGCTPATGAFAAGGAYHVRSTVPVTVYQFNSLEYVKAGVFSFTNDAALLLPVNAWRPDYVVAAWPDFSRNGSELAVTAAVDGTVVTITPRGSSPGGGGAPAFTAGTPRDVMLDAGDVLEITTQTQDDDLTGSIVTATAPVQVIAGQYCATVPIPASACDHLEESMFPVASLGTRYVVNAPALTTMPDGKPEVIRIVATEPGVTTVSYDPPQPGAPTELAAPGDFVELAPTAASFVITASAKVVVAQYMEGQSEGGNAGDPAMTLAVPVEQYRSRYLFHAPTSYDTNYIDVTAPVGATVTLDGAPVALAPIGDTGFALGRVFPLDRGPGGDGNHSIEGSADIGITVYGYGSFTSYWYPGGLELETIIE